MSITPADLAVGQVWRHQWEGTYELVHRVGDYWYYLARTDVTCGRDHEMCECSAESFAFDANEGGFTLVTPTPIPHPSALGDLYEACRDNMGDPLAEIPDDRTFPGILAHLAELMGNKKLLAHMASKKSTSAAEWSSLLARKAEQMDAAIRKAGGVA